MSASVSPPTPPGLTQSQASGLGPGIAGLFIQGLETGLVFAQISQWLYTRDHSESRFVSIVAVFVTAVGLYVPSGLSTA